MGIFDKIKGQIGAQFLDVIEWTSDDASLIAWRFPIFDKAIQDGGQLVVREGQVAIFVQEGVLSDVFGPGTYELSTNSPAISGFFDSIAYQFNNPKGDVLLQHQEVRREWLGHEEPDHVRGGWLWRP